MEWRALDIDEFIKNNNVKVPNGFRWLQDGEKVDHSNIKLYYYWAIFNKPTVDNLENIRMWSCLELRDDSDNTYRRDYGYWVKKEITSKLGNIRRG